MRATRSSGSQVISGRVDSSSSMRKSGAALGLAGSRRCTCTVSSSVIRRGSGLCHSGGGSTVIEVWTTLALRMRVIRRRIAATMSSFGVANSQAPPVSSANSLSRLDAGALPTPSA